MKTITKFIFGFASLALACGSIAFAQVQFEPVIPASSAAKAAVQAAVQGAEPLGASVSETVAFDSGSRWNLTLTAVKKFGLVITGASFQKSPASPFLYVLFDGRLGEIFVPYHAGTPRFLDISQHDFDPLPLPPAKFPPPRQIIGGGKICKEVRDYLAYMDAFTDTTRVRYGQEVIYFSVLDAFNYAYIMEWTFRDDGAILVRAGSTGPKFPSSFKIGHMHDFTWRLDIDLNGADTNSAYWTSHLEDLTAPSTAMDKKDLISTEGSRVWNPQHFNTLAIFDCFPEDGNPFKPCSTLENGNGRPTYYELVPMRSGTARHSEPYTKKDFWVTLYNPNQIFAVDLPTYIENPRPTVNEDLVIWYTGSEHHDGCSEKPGDNECNSRDEDFNTVQVLWTGFDLIPNNLFNKTPFYPGPTPPPTP
jgi:Cu2+-containing amine oxidase